MVEFWLGARIWRGHFYREGKVRLMETKEETNKVRGRRVSKNKKAGILRNQPAKTLLEAVRRNGNTFYGWMWMLFTRSSSKVRLGENVETGWASNWLFVIAI
jgi:hypothetical protein